MTGCCSSLCTDPDGVSRTDREKLQDTHMVRESQGELGSTSALCHRRNLWALRSGIKVDLSIL